MRHSYDLYCQSTRKSFIFIVCCVMRHPVEVMYRCLADEAVQMLQRSGSFSWKDSVPRPFVPGSLSTESLRIKISVFRLLVWTFLCVLCTACIKSVIMRRLWLSVRLFKKSVNHPTTILSSNRNGNKLNYKK